MENLNLSERAQKLYNAIKQNGGSATSSPYSESHYVLLMFPKPMFRKDEPKEETERKLGAWYAGMNNKENPYLVNGKWEYFPCHVFYGNEAYLAMDELKSKNLIKRKAEPLSPYDYFTIN